MGTTSKHYNLGAARGYCAVLAGGRAPSAGDLITDGWATSWGSGESILPESLRRTLRAYSAGVAAGAARAYRERARRTVEVES